MEKNNKIQLKLYLIIISIATFITSFIVSYKLNYKFIYVLSIMILGVILVILIDGLTAALFRSLPIKCANFKKRIFIVSKKEKFFYEKIKIKNWKDKIPEIGHFTGFRKNKVLDPKNSEYIKRFLHEICYGEMGHFASMFTGIFLLLIPWFKSFWIYLCIVIIIINAFLNLLPIFVLRYNSFTLYSIYTLLLKKNKTSQIN